MADDDKTPQGFSLKRWSHRKIEATREAATAETPAPAPSVSGPVATPGAAMVPAAEPALPPVESLTSESDFAAFMRPKVDEGLRRQALKKLFADPHFNVMDGLDVYIDDYTKPDPIAPDVLERLMQMGFVRDAGTISVEEAAPRSEFAARVAHTRRAGDGERRSSGGHASDACDVHSREQPGPGRRDSCG